VKNIVRAAAVTLLLAIVWIWRSVPSIRAGGLAPVVDIDGGVEKTIAFPAKDLTLFGHAIDPAFHAMTVQWSQISGPAPAVFSAPWALTTCVTFAAPGTYSFRLAVNNGTNTVTANNTVTVLGAESQTAFYVDPTYTGSGGDGSPAHPWTSLHASGATNNSIWPAINFALSKNNVVVYFSARQAGSDTPEVESRELDVWRTDTSTHRLTLDGMSKYNTSDVAPAWVNYSGLNRFHIAIANGSLSIGVQGPNNSFPMNYTTIRGFDVSGATGRVLLAGNYITLEYTHVHDILQTGANIQLQPPVRDYPNCTPLFGNLHDITVRGNIVDHGFGEGIYLSGTYFKAAQGGCVNWGNTHRDILVEKNIIDQTASNGGESDNIDMKAGLVNVTIRKNNLFGGAVATRGIVSTGVFPNPDGTRNTRTNFLVEDNGIHDRAGRAIDIQNQNGATIRNNVIANTAQGGINIESPVGESWPYTVSSRVEIFNNTIYNIGEAFANNDATLTIFENNLIAATAAIPPGAQELSKSSSSTVTTDYNIYIQGGQLGGGWTEGPHSIALPAGTALFVNPANIDFHLVPGSAAIGRGINLSIMGFTTDIKDMSRPPGTAAWDIGAYEFSPAQLLR
jgi:hypothetical protein